MLQKLDRYSHVPHHPLLSRPLASSCSLPFHTHMHPYIQMVPSVVGTSGLPQFDRATLKSWAKKLRSQVMR